jgi:hypothetical protein
MHVRRQASPRHGALSPLWRASTLITKRWQLSIVALALLAPLARFPGVVTRAQREALLSSTAASSSTQNAPGWSAPATPAQIQGLVTRVIENQHRDDEALQQYERKERIVSRRGKASASNERTTEVVSAGDRIIRVELERDGQTANADVIGQRWQQAIEELTREAKTDDADVDQNGVPEGRLRRERYEMVEAIGRAFCFHWIGRVNQDGHIFEPDPTFKSSKLFAMVYAHTVGTVWVDEASSQVVRLEVSLKDDLSLAEGLIVKVYRGAHATLQQDEVATGIWEPTHYSYDFEGRKLVLGTLSGHERMDASDYRRLGSPGEILATIRGEHPGLAIGLR